MTITIHIPDDLHAALTAQAHAKGVSEAGFVQQVVEQALVPASGNGADSELPVLHLGDLGALHRRDIYDDAR